MSPVRMGMHEQITKQSLPNHVTKYRSTVCSKIMYKSEVVSYKSGAYTFMWHERALSIRKLHSCNSLRMFEVGPLRNLIHSRC